jgi:serine protease Do
MDNDLLQRFFGQQFQRPSRGRQMPVPRQEGLGSGVIVSKDGYILTNNHVVDGADSVKVALQDGRDFEAKVIGRDPKTDVAVIKIDAKDLPTLELANSENIEVGDVVLAIGNPFGIGQTVTMGIVSAVGRGNMGLDYEDFIQTDAPINPGNSGGPVIDGEGRFVGMASSMATLARAPGAGSIGLGFAIPARAVVRIAEEIIATGSSRTPIMGVTLDTSFPGPGALLDTVTPGGPAESAGLRAGDVILRLAGRDVADADELVVAIRDRLPGEEVPVEARRGGRAFDTTVVLGSREDR